MKTTSVVLLAVLMVSLLAGVVRLVLVAASTETGWETVPVHWQDATVGWIGWEHTPVDELEPSLQARFWLTDEVDPENWAR